MQGIGRASTAKMWLVGTAIIQCECAGTTHKSTARILK